MEKTTDEQCWPLIISMTQSQHWSDQNVTSVWSFHVEDMVERICTEGLLLPFQSFMIKLSSFLPLYSYLLHRQRKHYHESLFNSIFLHISYQTIKREHITQEINSRNNSPNKQNSVIICHPLCHQTQLVPVCLMADWEALNTNSNAQNVQAAQRTSRGIKCPSVWILKFQSVLLKSYGFRRLGIQLMTRMNYFHGAFVSFLDLDSL